MPKGNNIPADDFLIKLLIIAYSKAGKTHYALQAALAGFNIVYLDGDVGRETLALQTEAIKERVYYIRAADSIEQARFSTFTYNVMTTGRVLWNDTESRMLLPTDGYDIDIWEIMFAALTNRDVLILDSWTALAKSCMRWAAVQENVNMADASKGRMRNVYGTAGLRLSMIMGMIQAARCHVIVLAHPTAFEKQSNPDDTKADSIQEKDKTIEWTRLVPMSSSNPNGATLAKHFTDVAWLEPTGYQNQRMLDFRPQPDRDSGGRFTERKDSEEYSFTNLVKRIGGFIPGADAPYETSGIVMHGPGDYAPADAATMLAPKVPTPVIIGSPGK